MAEKDLTAKILMSHADVFADCINTLVYGGEQRLRAEDMQPAPTESFYRGEKLHNQFNDTGRYLMESSTVIAQYIIENEMQLEERQILRKMSYQGGAYRQQLDSREKVYPVVCIVIAWTGKTNRIPLTLQGLLARNGVSSRELEYADDAKLLVYHMRNLSPEIRKYFISDMGFVADYLNEGNFDSRREQKIVHLEALCDMMTALTGDDRFMKQALELVKRQQKGETVMMCEYINELEARGEARGITIGEANGEKRGEKKGEARLSSLLQKLYDLGRDEEAKLAVRDMEARDRLYKEFLIANN